jgi:hypothetical protein
MRSEIAQSPLPCWGFRFRDEQQSHVALRSTGVTASRAKACASRQARRGRELAARTVPDVIRQRPAKRPVSDSTINQSVPVEVLSRSKRRP